MVPQWQRITLTIIGIILIIILLAIGFALAVYSYLYRIQVFGSGNWLVWFASGIPIIGPWLFPKRENLGLVDTVPQYPIHRRENVKQANYIRKDTVPGLSPLWHPTFNEKVRQLNANVGMKVDDSEIEELKRDKIWQSRWHTIQHKRFNYLMGDNDSATKILNKQYDMRKNLIDILGDEQNKYGKKYDRPLITRRSTQMNGYRNVRGLKANKRSMTQAMLGKEQKNYSPSAMMNGEDQMMPKKYYRYNNHAKPKNLSELRRKFNTYS